MEKMERSVGGRDSRVGSIDGLSIDPAVLRRVGEFMADARVGIELFMAKRDIAREQKLSGEQK